MVLMIRVLFYETEHIETELFFMDFINIPPAYLGSVFSQNIIIVLKICEHRTSCLTDGSDYMFTYFCV